MEKDIEKKSSRNSNRLSIYQIDESNSSGFYKLEIQSIYIDASRNRLRNLKLVRLENDRFFEEFEHLNPKTNNEK